MHCSFKTNHYQKGLWVAISKCICQSSQDFCICKIDRMNMPQLNNTHTKICSYNYACSFITILLIYISIYIHKYIFLTVFFQQNKRSPSIGTWYYLFLCGTRSIYLICFLTFLVLQVIFISTFDGITLDQNIIYLTNSGFVTNGHTHKFFVFCYAKSKRHWMMNVF